MLTVTLATILTKLTVSSQDISSTPSSNMASNFMLTRFYIKRAGCHLLAIATSTCINASRRLIQRH